MKKNIEMDNEKNKVSVEIHPEWYYPIKNMKVLILGTYPPHQDKRDFEFYYPNTQNHFWNILANIARVELKEFEGALAVAERKALMQSLDRGVQNLGKKIHRKGKSALDENIDFLEYQDLLGIINSSESLKVIILTGYSKKTNTYRSFIKYLKANKIPFTKPEKVKAGHQFNISCNRTVRCFISNSTSTTAARAGITIEMLVHQFRSAIAISNSL
ncbi:MAG: hypothetical protein ABL930_03855 [Pseudobdellovibrio sp.]